LNPRLLPLLLGAIVLAHVSSYVPCLQDDAFISFRYAQNLVEGQGLVFNPGDPVEGYTNFLWTLLMTVPQGVGLSVEWFATGLGILSVIGLVWLVASMAREREPALLLAAVPALLLAGDPPGVMEGVQGLETPLFALLVLGMVRATLREAAEPQERPNSAVLGALACLTRPEGALWFGITQGIRLLFEKRLPCRQQLRGWAFVATVLLSQLVFRLAYYGAPLPNTFHAKVGGGADSLARGLEYLGRFSASHTVFVVLACAGALQLLRRERHLLYTWMLVGSVCAWCMYVVAVGGDFKITWRFLQPIMALGALLALEALRAVRTPLPAWGVGAVALGLWGAFDFGPERERALAEARFREGVTRDRKLVGTWLAAHVRPDAVLAIHSSGTVPFYAKLATIDMWGLSDRHIASREMPDMGQGMPGHEKSDVDYVFGREPDLFVPEQDFLTSERQDLSVSARIPPAFVDDWRSMSAPIGRRWFNFFVRIPKDGPSELWKGESAG